MTTCPLSVIVVSYNSSGLLADCLGHLWAQLPSGAEVLVVDNASSDGCVDGLVDAFPGLELIRNARNVGYAAANNQALRMSRGDAVLLLNPDVVLGPSALDTALAYIQAHPDVGMLGARILLPDGRLDPPARRTFKTPATYLYKLTGLSWLFPRHPRFGRYYLSFLDEGQLTDVDAVVGAFLLVRRPVLDQIGLLDERFFMYCEDEDWCWRAKQAGWRVVYHPGVVVHHRKGSSTRQRPFAMIWHWHRSIFLYHRKNIAPRYPALVNGAVYGGMVLSLLATLSINTARRLAPALTRRAQRSGRPQALSLAGSPQASR